MISMRKGVLRFLVLAVLLAYPAAAFYPYRWEMPRVVRNTVEPSPAGGLHFEGPGPGIARTSRAPDWVADAKHTHRLKILLRVRPSLSRQWGPARILTLSADPSHRNITIGHDRKDLIVRIRTPWHTLNGSPQYRVPDVFRAGTWVDIRVLVEPGSLRAEVDGALRLNARLPEAPLRDWDRSYRLALGNELTGDRTWLGDIGRAIVRTVDRQVDYAAPSALEIPSRLWYFHRLPNLVPFRGVQATDAIMNLLGFVPLGLLVGLWAHRRGWAFAVGGAVLVFAASLALETLQLCIPHRHPSINDLILNTLGGVIGILLARWLGRPWFDPGTSRSKSE